MASSPIEVRPLGSPTERGLHFQFANQAFSSDPSPDNALYWQQVFTTRPDYRPEQLRGAFLEGEQLGSYLIQERMLRMGGSAANGLYRLGGHLSGASQPGSCQRTHA